ncbi:hypothetical protein Q1695_001456 [Nippostrongylus brasiliensis]|nr:hypothetical protein Q1695_001456 [Nippostrongylus brasiliensis]
MTHLRKNVSQVSRCFISSVAVQINVTLCCPYQRVQIDRTWMLCLIRGTHFCLSLSSDNQQRNNQRR